MLDDVLVNFDADRAKAAAAVLRDFAAAGHQLLVFTCHEHISKLFKSLKVPVSRLPGNSGPAEIVVSPEPRTEEKPKRERSPRALRRKAAPKEEIVENEPADDATQVEDGLDEADADDDDEDSSLWNDAEGGDNKLFDDDAAAA